MTSSVAAVVEQIADEPGLLGLGSPEVLRVLPSGLLLKGESVLYTLDLQLGPTDDRQLIRFVERWAAVRRQHADRRCFAVLVAGQYPPRYVGILGVICTAVPIVAMELREVEGELRFSPIGLS